MPIIAVMTGEGQRPRPTRVTRIPNGETEVVKKVMPDGSEEIHVEGPFHVDHGQSGGGKERMPTTFEAGLGC